VKGLGVGLGAICILDFATVTFGLDVHRLYCGGESRSNTRMFGDEQKPPGKVTMGGRPCVLLLTLYTPLRPAPISALLLAPFTLGPEHVARTEGGAGGGVEGTELACSEEVCDA